MTRRRAQELRLDGREDLINALNRAAELEHGVCCMYLFAAFALRKGRDEGLTWAETETNREWAATLLRIAREEMGHLATVCNLLTAIGGSPHLYRPPFPHRAALGPQELRLELQPFTLETAATFVRLEAAESEAAGDLPVDGPPSPGAYWTIGELYGDVRAAFELWDERTLFVGSPTAQLGLNVPSSVTMCRVTDRASALAAIDLVVDESEKGPDSHLSRFKRLHDELQMRLDADPDFSASRPVVANPGSTDAPITDERTVALLDLFNNAYTAMLMMIGRLAAPSGESRAELEMLRTLAYLPLMTMVIRPLGELLTTLPVGDSLPGMSGGPSFEVRYETQLPPDKDAAWSRLEDRLHDITEAAEGLASGDAIGPRSSYLYENLWRMEDNFRRVREP